MRQFEREITALLGRAPSVEPTARAKETAERDQAIVPVMIAGNRKHIGVRRVTVAQGGAVRLNGSLFVLLASGTWIDLIAAKDQNAASLGLVFSLLVWIF